MIVIVKERVCVCLYFRTEMEEEILLLSHGRGQCRLRALGKIGKKVTDGL